MAKDTRSRLSITVWAATARHLKEMATTGLSKNDLFLLSIDVLHFFWCVLRRKGQVGVRLAGEEQFTPVHMFIPGMYQPFDTLGEPAQSAIQV